MFTRRQLYDLYEEGSDATVRLVEELLDELAEQEQRLGWRQQRTIDLLAEWVGKPQGATRTSQSEAGA